MVHAASATPSSGAPSIRWTELSGSDRAKVALINVTKVAIPIIFAAAAVVAAWFLAPVVIPAGMFLFGASMAGLIGGGAALAGIEAVFFRQLNKLEADIYKKAQFSKDMQPDAPTKKYVETKLNTPLSAEESRDQIERDLKGQVQLVVKEEGQEDKIFALAKSEPVENLKKMDEERREKAKEKGGEFIAYLSKKIPDQDLFNLVLSKANQTSLVVVNFIPSSKSEVIEREFFADQFQVLTADNQDCKDARLKPSEEDLKVTITLKKDNTVSISSINSCVFSAAPKAGRGVGDYKSALLVQSPFSIEFSKGDNGVKAELTSIQPEKVIFGEYYLQSVKKTN